ncbi:hypothetical protein AOLI_G00305470 [Acnodon oligacanthus]
MKRSSLRAAQLRAVSPACCSAKELLQVEAFWPEDKGSHDRGHKVISCQPWGARCFQQYKQQPEKPVRS